MSIKNRILFVGVGQGGGNITNLFEKMGYTCAYINSSNHDLDTVDTEYANKFHLPGANGCSRDRLKAQALFKKHGEEIVDFIANGYPNKDLIFVVFTKGGGTGAGMGPALMNALTEIFPDRYVGGITAAPSLDDNVQSVKNGAATLAKVSSVRKSATVFMIDNNKGPILKLNREFVELFDSMINATRLDKRGIIDDNEIFTLLTTPGVSVIMNTYEDKTGRVGLKNTVFMDYARSRQTIAGISCKNNAELLQDVLDETVGFLKNTFVGYNNEKDIVVLSGLSYKKELMDEMVEVVKEKEAEMETEGYGVLTNPFADEENEVSGYVAKEQNVGRRRDRRSILKNYFN